MATGAGRSSPRRESVLRGRRTASLEKSQIPFFAGWQEHAASSVSGQGQRRGYAESGSTAVPSPQPSPRTAPSEGEERPVFLGGNNPRVGIVEPAEESDLLRLFKHTLGIAPDLPSQLDNEGSE